MRYRRFISGILIGVGLTLIIDKIWWKYFAKIYDNPLNHYTTGIILIILGIITYYKYLKTKKT